MATAGSPPPGRPTARPYGPRRRAWLLVAVTVVALAPLGIGFGVGQLAGGARPPATTTTFPVPADHPPAATVAGGRERVTALLGAYCWYAGGHGVCTEGVSAAPSDEPVLRVARGAAVTVTFATGARPATVSIGPAYGPSHPLVPGNPTRFHFTARPGRYPVVIDTTWPGHGAGHASYLVRVEVG